MALSKDSIRDYDIIKQIGSGSFGVVYLVKQNVPTDPRPDTLVMKQISLAKLDARQRTDANKEILLLSTLSHPNIVSYRHSFENEIQQLHIIMDYCDGGDLYKKITERKRSHAGPFNEHQLVQWFVQLCLALKYIHDRKILHRDLKTQNIFACHGDRIVKLGDFGIAKILDHTADLAATCVGTPYYLSPEVCQNRPYGTKTDVWALGCVFYELSTFRHPFEGRHLTELLTKIVKGSYEPLSSTFSISFRNLVSQMLKVNSGERPDVNGLLQRKYVYEHATGFLKKSERLEEIVILENLMKDKVGRKARSSSLVYYPRQYSTPRKTVDKKFQMYVSPQIRIPAKTRACAKGALKTQGKLQKEKDKLDNQVPSDPTPPPTEILEKEKLVDGVERKNNLTFLKFSPEVGEELSRDPGEVEENISAIVSATSTDRKRQRKKWAIFRQLAPGKTPAENLESERIRAFIKTSTFTKHNGIPAFPCIPGSVDNELENRVEICDTCGMNFFTTTVKRMEKRCRSCQLQKSQRPSRAEAICGKSIFEKIECLRQELETKLGIAQFAEAYHLMAKKCDSQQFDEETKDKIETLLFFEKAYLT